MITPTIGRVVLFFPSKRAEGDSPQAAVITKVWSDSLINIGTWDANGMPSQGCTSVALIEHGKPVPAGENYCTWMPFQEGQAAKTQELAAKLEELAEFRKAFLSLRSELTLLKGALGNITLPTMNAAPAPAPTPEAAPAPETPS